MAPVFCIILFIVHLIDLSIFPYVLYWLIFIVLYIFNARTIFTSLLGNTMVAHAVSFIIWLYVMLYNSSSNGIH